MVAVVGWDMIIHNSDPRCWKGVFGAVGNYKLSSLVMLHEITRNVDSGYRFLIWKRVRSTPTSGSRLPDLYFLCKSQSQPSLSLYHGT